ncbi:CRE-ASNS-1 protein [Aphelenchoides avenae]|nr:CRE-ASNS-1 protein [Aphelenchus avenae]
MCGIWALIGDEYQPAKHGAEFMKIAGRGPDLTVVCEPGNAPSSQPVVASNLSVVCNGEIYNHLQLKEASKLDEDSVQNAASDCAAIVHSFVSTGFDLAKCCASLDGVFAFVMCDGRYLYVGRDPIGVRPLFYGRTKTGGYVFGSEIKCVERLCEIVHYVPPGSCATLGLQAPYATIKFQRYYAIPSTVDETMTIADAENILRHLLVDAVKKRLMGNRQFGFMLSGGLDSSLVASIATKFLQDKPTAFSVGFEDSPDLLNAQKVAEFLDIPHKILVITPEECIKVIPEVVYALETFDPLVVRCGVPHFLLCRYISRTSKVKVLLSGEGADELFGSYAYMQRAPTLRDLHREIVRRLRRLHQYDVLRCDRATSCHGLEIRVPFLDKKFLKFSATLPPSLKLMPNKIEKYVLRKAFTGWLPDDVLERSKEGFSEALGKTDLGDVVHEHANLLISDEYFAKRVNLYPWRTPETKEEFWYRTLFEDVYDSRKVETVVHTKVYRQVYFVTA